MARQVLEVYAYEANAATKSKEPWVLQIHTFLPGSIYSHKVCINIIGERGKLKARFIILQDTLIEVMNKLKEEKGEL